MSDVKLGWRPALDGLRGVAVLGVMLRHMPTIAVFPGGQLGVDVFFVISGFLITTLLLQEYVTTGGISLRRFYARRALRLLPAVLVLLAIYCVISLTVAPPGRVEPNRILVSVIAALVYLLNWVSAFGGSPAAGALHLWSLSIEEQFYLLWPALLVLLLRLRLSSFFVLILSAAIAICSAALPLVESDYARLYFGTDYRMHQLLIGCIAGQLFMMRVIEQRIVENPIFKLALAVAAVFFLYWLFALRDPSAFMMSAGYTAVALCSVVIVVGCLYVESGIPKTLLASQALVYVGRRSYGLYLWHYPINSWLINLDDVTQCLAVVLLTFAAAELSYRLVEQPALALKSRLKRQRAPTSVVPQALPASAI